MTDTIEKTLHLNAPLETVWNAVSTPEGISLWFSDRVIGDLAPGTSAELVWGEFVNPIQVVSREPMTHFAYKWVPGSPVEGFEFVEENMTTVEFFLTPDGDKTTLRVIESGFSNLPQSHIARCFKDNSDGWVEELAKLEKLYA